MWIPATSANQLSVSEYLTSSISPLQIQYRRCDGAPRWRKLGAKTALHGRALNTLPIDRRGQDRRAIRTLGIWATGSGIFHRAALLELRAERTQTSVVCRHQGYLFNKQPVCESVGQCIRWLGQFSSAKEPSARYSPDIRRARRSELNFPPCLGRRTAPLLEPSRAARCVKRSSCSALTVSRTGRPCSQLSILTSLTEFSQLIWLV